ncbi:MAG: ATP-binding cassette domain-containing protein [Clostridia bacterium]|nr:ATP-binding cassette domain-containing protein [Clostridia bacterium]
MIQIKNLTKNYGKIRALKDVSFDVKRGDVLGFLGPNGAGKSTAMNIITGYLAPTDGKVLIDGEDITENPKLAKSKIGYLPELPPLYGDMTVKEYLNFICDIKNVEGKKRKNMLDDIMYLVKIGDKRDRLVRNLSKGYRQRVGFAQALVGDPPLLILDEPTVGLDPKQVVEFRKIITALGRNHTIILSTHILQEVTAVCNSVVIINNGKLAASGSVADFSSDDGLNRLVVTLDCGRDAGQDALAKVSGVKNCTFSRIEKNCSVFNIISDKNVDVRRQVFRACAENDLPIVEMRPVGKTLEEFFVDVISKDDAGEGGEE